MKPNRKIQTCTLQNIKSYFEIQIHSYEKKIAITRNMKLNLSCNYSYISHDCEIVTLKYKVDKVWYVSLDLPFTLQIVHWTF